MDHMRGLQFKAQRERQIKLLILINVGCFFMVGLAVFAWVLFTPQDGEAHDQTATARVVIEKEPAINMIDVLVPIRQIDSGEALHPAMFKQEPRPEISVSERIVRSFSDINGLYSRSVIMPGEPLSKDYLTRVRSSNVITANIPDGFRAVTITVDNISAVEGWARPGARVDVAWTSSVLGKTSLKFIVQNALVLSTDRQLSSSIEPGADVPPTVTLLVSTRDSAKIMLAASTGALTLALRGERDHGKDAGFSNLTVYDLLDRGNPDDSTGDSVEGFAKYKNADGQVEEMVVMNNRVLRKAGMK